MADYPAGRAEILDDQLSTGLGRYAEPGYFGGTAQWNSEVGAELVGLDFLPGGAWERNPARAQNPAQDFGAAILPTGPEDDWFDHVIVIPLSINAGIVLATEVFQVTVYSSYKSENRTLDTFANGPGSGVLVTGIPTLPEAIFPQSGFDVTVTILAEGPPVITGDLTFTFDVQVVDVPVTGQRTILFPHEPLSPMEEVLIWATDVRQGRAGTEQRAALREIPRSRWEMRFQAEGKERRVMELNLFDSQARIFGVPMWQEAAVLRADASATDLTVTVDSTDYSYFQAGGLAMLYTSFDDFEALTVDSLTSTTLTFQTALTKNFPSGARVLPVRLGSLLGPSAPGRRFPLNLQEVTLAFTSRDNDLDLSDTSGFSSYAGKVLFDDPNMVRGQMSETLERSVFVTDSVTGKLRVYSEWPSSRRTQAKTFFSRTRQRAWETRQVLHALRGRHVSFYIPTFSDDLTPTQGVSSGGTSLTVENVGYTKFASAKQPKDAVRLTLDDGTTVIRQVLSSTEIDEDEEQLTVDAGWGVDATADEIERIEFVEKSRMNSDEIRLRHQDALGTMVAVAPVIAVLD